MGIKLHPRYFMVREAAYDLSNILMEWRQEYDLTDVEVLQLLQHEQAVTLKDMLRHERHPNNPELKGDEADKDSRS